MISRFKFCKSCRWPGLVPAALGALGGAAWLIGGTSLLGPLLSLLLPVATTLSRSRTQAWMAALIYYLIGSVSIPAAITGYYGTGHAFLGLLAWAGSSAALALPWMFGRSWAGRLLALAATALPPLGVIGWLSPLNAAGVLFPITQWPGLLFTVILIAELGWIIDLTGWIAESLTARIVIGFAILASMIVPIGLVSYSNGAHIAKPPANWIGLNTHLPPAHGKLGQDIANKRALIEAARNQGRKAEVLVFPEAVLDDWWVGTRQQFASAVPAGQVWIIGAQADAGFLHTLAQPDKRPINAVVSVEQDRALLLALTAAAGLLLGGNWTPWNGEGVQPASGQRAFELGGQRVWASLCVEQLQPWTWLMAMSQKSTLILAMSNDWWASAGSFAPRIQVASAKSWARLMGVPVVWAVNSALLR